MSNIGWAVERMHDGDRVCRSGWSGKGMWLALQLPPVHGARSPQGVTKSAVLMTAPYVYMKTADDKLVPWLCSQTDLLATDWELV